MDDYELILKLREITDSQERQRIINEVCGEDLERKRRIEDVTMASDRVASPDGKSEGFSYDSDPATAPFSKKLQPRSSGVMLGDYRLVNRIGEGGMGEVWIAEQFVPVRRSVAIKLIKAGLHSDSVVARFEQERQTLALMDHPNIAKIFDAGMAPVIGLDGEPTGPGLPFFVMELVSGVPLNRYCDEAKLSIPDRLKLFIGICNAVQHAHQKGIVHRDLKPGNILVANVDGVPTPKVIDFGVAKAITGELKDWSKQTQFGTAIGTLEYMAPEQAGGQREGIDTRADIFSLGVILYELLTGLRPHDANRFREAALDEAIRIVREEVPARPSTRLLSTDRVDQAAAARQTDSRKLVQLLQGDLDWVVIKCLEKNRNRRYDSASDLAAEIRRFLDNEPVEARAPNSGYIFRKFFFRHRRAVVAAGGICLSLLLGFAGTAWQLARAIKAERQATRERDEKDIARAQEALRANAEAAERVRAEKAEAEAKERLVINQEIVDFLRKDLLQQSGTVAQIDRKFEPKRDLSVREALDRAASSAGDRWKDRPEIEGPLREAIGLSYRDLDELALALPHLRAVASLNMQRLGPDHEETLTSQMNVATTLFELGDQDEGTALTQQILERRQRILGNEHPHTLTTLMSIASINRIKGDYGKAIEILERVRDIRLSSAEPNEVDLIPVYGGLALAYQDAGRIDDALSLYRKNEEICRKIYGDEHPKTISAIANVAYGQSAAGMTREVVETRLKVVNAYTKLYGPDHSDTLTALLNLGMTYLDFGRNSEAISLYRDLVERRQSKLGAEHPDTLKTLNNLAGALLSDGKFTEASTIYEKLVQIETRRQGATNPYVLTLMNNLAASYQDSERVTEAIKLYEQALPNLISTVGSEHPLTLHTQHNMANALRKASRNSEALEIFERLVETRRRLLGAEHPDTLLSVFGLAGCYRTAGRLNECLQTLKDLHAVQVRKLGEDHPETMSTLGGLAVMNRAVGNTQESLEIFAKLVPMAKQKMGLEYPSTQVFMKNYAAMSEKLGDWGKAADLWSELIEAERKRIPPGDRRLGDSIARLGAAQLKANRAAEAEKSLREALAIMIKKEPDDWFRFYLEYQVGQSLVDQDKGAEAKQLFTSGLAGLQQHAKDIPEDWSGEVHQAADLAIQWARQQGLAKEVELWEKAKQKFPKELPPANAPK